MRWATPPTPRERRAGRPPKYEFLAAFQPGQKIRLKQYETLPVEREYIEHYEAHRMMRAVAAFARRHAWRGYTRRDITTPGEAWIEFVRWGPQDGPIVPADATPWPLPVVATQLEVIVQDAPRVQPAGSGEALEGV